ncbi:hypothetical protein CHS0354_042312 [Potamilus streckersoni]|uniref:Uncharacterized protein n=1 Tax=Potamilus streckersoni TaxID=2493646 RepID=A0AAE0W2E4_9BIVA|nr:hypothetical protein CHS0354_042312 [Potamilus streckersoni]
MLTTSCVNIKPILDDIKELPIYLGAAAEKLNYEHQDGGIISVLLKKIRDLEERDREFDRKLEEIDVLKERLDEAQRRLTNMQELEYRLEKAQE